MDQDEIYRSILPYLSKPKEIEEFLEKHRGKPLEDIIHAVNEAVEGSKTPLSTDYKILLNALLKLKD